MPRLLRLPRGDGGRPVSAHLVSAGDAAHLVTAFVWFGILLGVPRRRPPGMKLAPSLQQTIPSDGGENLKGIVRAGEEAGRSGALLTTMSKRESPAAGAPEEHHSYHQYPPSYCYSCLPITLPPYPLLLHINDGSGDRKRRCPLGAGAALPLQWYIPARGTSASAAAPLVERCSGPSSPRHAT